MPIEIHDDGSVTIPRQSRDRSAAWEEILAPGDPEAAAAVLDDEALAEVHAKWNTMTQEEIEIWHEQHPDYVSPTPPKPEPPTLEERLADVERAVTDVDATARQKVRDNMQRLTRDSG